MFSRFLSFCRLPVDFSFALRCQDFFFKLNIFVFSPRALLTVGELARRSRQWRTLDLIRRCATPAVPRRRPSGSGTRPPETFSAASATKRTKAVPPSIELRRRWSVQTSSSSGPDCPCSGTGRLRPASTFSPAGRTTTMPSVSFGRSERFLRSSIRRRRNNNNNIIHNNNIIIHYNHITPD